MTSCSICRTPLASDRTQLPTGEAAHHDCAIDRLTEHPDREKALVAWSRLSGKRMGAAAVAAWLQPRIRGQLWVADGRRGLVIEVDGELLLELVPVSANNLVVMFVAGRRIVVRTAQALTGEINVLLRQHEPELRA